MSRRAGVIAAIILLILPVLRVASTYRVFCQTIDEPVHIAAGLQWLTARVYDYDPEHPPLARALFGIDAALAGSRAGDEILWRDGRYLRNLAAARAPNLLFLVIALAVVGLWTRERFGDAAALLAMALLGGLPPLLGHAGVATTDMAAAATVFAACYAFERWLRTPTWQRAAAAGLVAGLAVSCKFSALVFLPIAGALFFITRPRWRPAQLVAMPLLAFAVVWSVYKFDIGKINDARLQAFPPGLPPHAAAEYANTRGYDWVRVDLLERYYAYSERAAAEGVRGIDFVDWAKAAQYPSPAAARHGNTMAGAPPLPRLSLVQRITEPLRAMWQIASFHWRVPAPMFFVGIEKVKQHSDRGHANVLFGKFSDHGWWYYFPVVIFFKTPLAFLALALGGAAIALRRRTTAAYGLAPFAMLLPAMQSGINIGLRHVLPLYPFLAILAAVAALALWRRSRFATILLLGWFGVAGVTAHPDYLASFNEAAGRHPEHIAIDSNLDWGQDLLRLADVVRREHIRQIYLSYFGSANWRRLIPEAKELPQSRVRGWVAVSENQFVFGWPSSRRDAYRWLTAYDPPRRIGASIRLYHVP